VYGGGSCGVVKQNGSVLFDLVDAAARADLGEYVSILVVRQARHNIPLLLIRTTWLICAGDCLRADCCSPGDVERLAAILI
jgi:hypothetical protein